MTVNHPNVRSVQDVPPPGGYPQINMKRGGGHRGPPGWLIWLGVCTFSVYGMYKAESDRKLMAQINESLRQEREAMKNVEGWKVGESVYSKRWMPPTPGLSN
eukprot:gene1922-3733_t